MTGGGSGLGREICLELARRGCKLAVVDVNSKGCYETVELLSKIPRCVAKAYKVSSLAAWIFNGLITRIFIPERRVIASRASTDGRQGGKGTGSRGHSGQQCLPHAHDFNTQSEER